MKRHAIRLQLLAALLYVVGCGLASQIESRESNRQLMQLEVGMDRDAVLSLMGDPYRREVYGDNEFLIYETDAWASNESERFTPILIRAGKVSGWGRNYYDNTVRSSFDANINITPE